MQLLSLFVPLTSCTLGPATAGCSLDGFARFVHTPAETCGGPALSGLVASLLITLRLVGAQLAGFLLRLILALGHR